ncbi:MAG TPA: carboxypeptidase regulatory-like domain-containing protein, partial [Planctomycetota bacterium]|nr:carboxypeptidase regulatory-like domain-containing protein [Planctomycetota bacterium]
LACVELASPRDGARVDLEIACWPVATVRGRVVGADGRPAQGVVVRVETPGRFDGGPLLPSFVGAAGATTDAEGRYRLERVSASRGEPARVIAAASLAETRGECRAVSAPLELRARAGEVVDAPDLVLSAEPSASIEVASRDGSPVWNAVVVDETLGQIDRTDREGRVRMRFPDGTSKSSAPASSPADAARVATVNVRAPGYAPATSAPFRPSAEAPPTVRVVLDRARVLRGRARLGDGAPAAGAWVRARAGAAWVTSARADATGAFEMRNAPAVALHLEGLWSIPPRLGETSRVIRAEAEATAAATDVDVRFAESVEAPPTAALVGTVVDDATGLPILRPRVTLGDGLITITARTAGPGEFRIDRAPAGAWRLRATAPGYAAVDVPEQRVPSPSIALRLRRGTTLRGVVSAPEGLSLAGAFLKLVDAADASDEEGAAGRVGDGGRFEVRGLRPGLYRPVLVPDDGVADMFEDAEENPRFLGCADPAPIEIPDGRSETTVALRFAYSSRLYVEVRAASAARALRVIVRDAADRVVADRRAKAAAWFLPLTLPAGEYRVELEDAGAPTAARTVRLEERKSAKEEFALP